MNGSEKLTRKLRLNKLYDVYHQLLNESQRQVLVDYCFIDLSISEIAENSGVSRQAVSERIKGLEQHLEELEDKIGFIFYQEKTENLISELRVVTKPDQIQRIIEKYGF